MKQKTVELSTKIKERKNDMPHFYEKCRLTSYPTTRYLTISDKYSHVKIIFAIKKREDLREISPVSAEVPHPGHF
jgi:hypothetical protein